MTERNQAEEISRAADRFAESARELTATLNRLLEFQERAWDQLEGSGQRSEGLHSLVNPVEHRVRELSEEAAVEFALAADLDVRRGWSSPSDREERLPAPSPDEVRKRREERRRREDAEDRS